MPPRYFAGRTTDSCHRERHNDADSPPVSLRLKGDDLFLRCGEHWLERHPLSWRELEVEQDQQRLAGLQLHLEDAPEGGARAHA